MLVKIRRTLLLLSLLNIFIPSRGQQKFSLADAQSYALANNVQIKNAKADYEIALKKIAETSAMGLPQVNGEGNFQHFLDIPTQVIPANAFDVNAPSNLLLPVKFGTDFNSSASLTATQLLFSGEYIVALQASKTYSQTSKNLLAKTEQEIKHAIAQSYYLVLIAEESKKVLEKTFENNSKTLNETKIIFENGFIEESDVEQLALLVSTLKVTYNKANRQIELAHLFLKLNMGLPFSDSLILTDNINQLLTQSQNSNSFQAELKPENHIDFKLISSQIKLMELNVKREKSRSLPTLSAFFNHSQNAFRNEFNFFDNKSWYPATIWGLKLNVPIFGSGQLTARVKQARLEFEKVENQKNLTEKNIQTQFKAAKIEFENANEQLATQKMNLALSEKIQEKTLKKYKEGLASSLDLNQAQNQYLNIQSDYFKAIFEFLNASQNLEKAVGL